MFDVETDKKKPFTRAEQNKYLSSVKIFKYPFSESSRILVKAKLRETKV